MYIKVKTMDGKESVILTVSKMSVIEDIRKMIKEKLNVEPQCQRLFFRGKQVRSRFSPFLCVMMMIVSIADGGYLQAH